MPNFKSRDILWLCRFVCTYTCYHWPIHNLSRKRPCNSIEAYPWTGFEEFRSTFKETVTIGKKKTPLYLIGHKVKIRTHIFLYKNYLKQNKLWFMKIGTDVAHSQKNIPLGFWNLKMKGQGHKRLINHSLHDQ
jgi:hypothetical protein